ncbi:MAG: glycosyltransferase family 2 protein [Bacteroidetes bacterium]|nr:glycosyltransferase family 2 protein [Bacteroidota bacterium]MBU1372306.1 glycosyltransferase family 2 protein [Bacteroidota bacterium]MBU1484060.1 glycosyltransferase family 2 protein [Bacteroidota bacterium]MBU1759798.1 glycosyltransferase family 2 protein [Bacteroidota bacterium]MBU2268876.1 glycosyltransferase family 2 protein [Bacteroidota bacterium]
MSVSLFRLPSWIKPHRYTNKKFTDLIAAEINDLKLRISKFQDQSPEVSIIIPAWNEENNIFRALSSLASAKTNRKIEIVVINNNSTDNTQQVLDTLGVRNYFQPEQGITFARQLGLENAKGRYHLCADSDSFYPPNWIEAMITPMEQDKSVVGVYARYAFLPITGNDRFLLWFYERFTGIMVWLRKRNREYINFLGFNMGFVTKVALENGGFKVTDVRKFNNALGSEDYVHESEDGRMAINLQKTGKLKLVRSNDARVFTSSRRLIAEGGLLKSFINRIKIHSKRISEYVKGK